MRSIITVLFIISVIMSISFVMAGTDASTNVQSGLALFTGKQFNVTINSINTTQSFLLLSVRSNQSSPDVLRVMGEIVNSTQIRFTKQDTGNSVFVEWQVVSDPDLSVQSVKVNYASADTTQVITINSVNTSNSFVIISQNNSNAANNIDKTDWLVSLKNATAVNLTRFQISSAGLIYWQVVSWNGASITTGRTTLSNSLATVNFATPYNLSNSFLLLSDTHNINFGSIGSVKGKFVNATQIAFSNENTTDPPVVEYFVITDPSLYVQSGEDRYTGLGSMNYTINSINTSRTFSILSLSNNVEAGTWGRAFATNKIFNSTTLQVEKNLAAANINISYFGITFINAAVSNFCPAYTALNYNLNCGCNVTSNTILSGIIGQKYNVTIIGNGTTVINANITNTAWLKIKENGAGCRVVINVFNGASVR